MMLSDTLSNLEKFNQGEYSNYQLCSSKFDKAHVYSLFFKDKLILNGPSVIQGDQDVPGHPQRPRQAQPWGEQQVPLMSMKNLYGTCLYSIFQR